MTITRRTFLSSLAAVGLAPALPGALPAATPATSPTAMWQDLARTIPAVADGDVVMVVDAIGGPPAVARSVASAPTLSKSSCGQMALAVNVVDDFSLHLNSHSAEWLEPKKTSTAIPAEDGFRLSNLYSEAGGVYWQVGKPIQYY